MRIDTCYFCSSPCYPGHGTTFVRNDSKVFKFCRKKCHSAFQKKRNPRKVKWTKASRKSAGKDLKVDASFEFEKRRNRPVRYDRDLMAATITTMKRVKEIQMARESRFHEQRFKGVKTSERARQKAEVAAHLDLVRPASARLRAAERNAQEKARLAEGAGGGGMKEER